MALVPTLFVPANIIMYMHMYMYIDVKRVQRTLDMIVTIGLSGLLSSRILNFSQQPLGTIFIISRCRQALRRWTLLKG